MILRGSWSSISEKYLSLLGSILMFSVGISLIVVVLSLLTIFLSSNVCSLDVTTPSKPPIGDAKLPDRRTLGLPSNVFVRLRRCKVLFAVTGLLELIETRLSRYVLMSIFGTFRQDSGSLTALLLLVLLTILMLCLGYSSEPRLEFFFTADSVYSMQATKLSKKSYSL